MLLAFVALARPQFGSGTRLIPATNLDVVDRARLLEEHVRARRRAEPHRAREGRGRAPHPGPAGRALRRRGVRGRADELPAHERRRRDRAVLPAARARTTCPSAAPPPRARSSARASSSRATRSRRTTCASSSSSPTARTSRATRSSVAQSCAQEGTRIDVVQIGGRAPEVIPEVGADGKVSGMRTRRRGQAAHDASSRPRARRSSRRSRRRRAATIVRAEHGDTGIDKIAAALAEDDARGARARRSRRSTPRSTPGRSASRCSCSSSRRCSARRRAAAARAARRRRRRS